MIHDGCSSLDEENYPTAEDERLRQIVGEYHQDGGSSDEFDDSSDGEKEEALQELEDLREEDEDNEAEDGNL